MKKLRLGIVGCGGWATETHMPYLMAQPNVQIVGIADFDAVKRSREFKEKYKVTNVTETLEHLLAKSELDGLIVSTPNKYHFPHALAALEKGIHVHVDKPLSTLKNEINTLIETAESHNLILGTHTQRKYMPGHSKLKWCLSKYFSKLYHISGEIWQPVFDDYFRGWRGEDDFSGGILMDSGFHIIDTILSMVGIESPSRFHDVQSLKHNAGKPNDAFSTLIFRIDEIVIQVNAFRGTPQILKKESYQILGDGGYLHLQYTKAAHKTYEIWFIDDKGIKRVHERLILTSAHNFYPLQLFLEAVSGNDTSRGMVKRNTLFSKLTGEILDRAYF